MARRFDIVVVGGGLVGAAAAGLFAGDGFNVAVVERGRGGSGGDGGGGAGDGGDGAGDGTDDSADSRVSAINLAAAALFKHLDAWPPGDATVCAYRAMKVWDRNTSAKIVFRAADLGRDRLGSIVENRVLVAALREKLRSHARVAWLDDTEITAIDARGAALRVELSGETLETQLLVGADGANSKVRELAGIATARRDFEQDAITATVTVAEHRHTAWQCFLDTGPAALLPLADGRCALVWSCARGLADELMALPAEDFCARLQAGFAGGGGGGGQFCDEIGGEFSGEHGRIGDKFGDEIGDEFGSQLGAITDCGSRRRFPLVQHHADSYLAASAPVALIGDAAHAIHPLAGLGANIGLVDAAALAEVVSQSRARGAGPGKYATLRRYERWRRGDNAAVVQFMAGFHDLFRSRAPAAKIARAAGFNCADRSPPLKAALAGCATGLRGDLPKVCRGV